MENALLEALRETEGKHYVIIELALQDFTAREILDIYLRYEGITGYTDHILSALVTLGVVTDIEDDDFCCL